MRIRKYTALMRSQIKVDLAYTAWYWASMFSVTMRLFILYFFWQAVYANKTDVSGISLSTMLTYAVLATMIDQFRGACDDDRSVPRGCRTRSRPDDQIRGDRNRVTPSVSLAR